METSNRTTRNHLELRVEARNSECRRRHRSVIGVSSLLIIAPRVVVVKMLKKKRRDHREINTPGKAAREQVFKIVGQADSEAMEAPRAAHKARATRECRQRVPWLVLA